MNSTRVLVSDDSEAFLTSIEEKSLEHALLTASPIFKLGSAANDYLGSLLWLGIRLTKMYGDQIGKVDLCDPTTLWTRYYKPTGCPSYWGLRLAAIESCC